MSRQELSTTTSTGYAGALDVETEVPTPQGLATVGSLAQGDTVFGSDGHPVTVQFASAVLEDRDCFAIEFSTGERIVADEEQRLLTERRDLPPSVASPTRRSTADVAADVASLGPAALAVRVAPPVQLPSKRLAVTPYLLGVWLGAGLSSQPAVRGADEELIRRLTNLGVRVFTSGIPGQHWLAVPGGSKRGADLGSRLRALGVLDDKHLPMSYLRAGEDQRRDLLAGLLDSAAVVSHGGEIVFPAPTAAVAHGVHELIASLGFRPWFRPGRLAEVAFLTGEEVFKRQGLQQQLQARRRLAADIRPRRLVVSVEPVAPRPVRQLRVGSDDGLLLVGRSFIPLPGTVPLQR